MAKALTRKQKAILDFIRGEIERRGRPPTIREIGERFGLRSTGSVRDHLRALERKGHIDRRHHLSRGIALRRPTRQAAPQAPRPVPRPLIPLLGEIAAGQPRLAIEHPDEAGDLALQYNETLDAEFQRASMRAEIPLIDTGGVPIGTMDQAVWQSTQEILLEQGFISSPVDLSALYTNEFVGKAE